MGTGPVRAALGRANAHSGGRTLRGGRSHLCSRRIKQTGWQPLLDNDPAVDLDGGGTTRPRHPSARCTQPDRSRGQRSRKNAWQWAFCGGRARPRKPLGAEDGLPYYLNERSPRQ